MPNAAHINWDELRFVLAVADQGSVAGAGRVLGVNHSTVLRRIAGFETRNGVRIFEKTAHGYQVAPDRRAMIEALREAGNAVGQVERMIAAERPRISSSIRLTSTDAFCHDLIPRIVSSIVRDLNGPVTVLSGNAHLDFSRLQADITIRPAVRLPDELDGKASARFRFGVFAKPGGDDAWLGLEGAIGRSRAQEWLERHVGPGTFPLSADSFVSLAGMAAQGRGRAVLPVFLGDSWPGLQRLDILDSIPPTPIWVASHVDLMQSGRLKRSRGLLSEALAAEEPYLMGEASRSRT